LKYNYLLSVLVALTSSVVVAETTNSTNNSDITMPVIVVTATRDAHRIQETPYSTSSISADDLRIENAVRTVPEALKYEPG